jgi:hypothetical protein
VTKSRAIRGLSVARGKWKKPEIWRLPTGTAESGGPAISIDAFGSSYS